MKINKEKSKSLIINFSSTYTKKSKENKEIKDFFKQRLVIFFDAMQLKYFSNKFLIFS